jgi:hypothetical protein
MMLHRVLLRPGKADDQRFFLPPYSCFILQYSSMSRVRLSFYWHLSIHLVVSWIKVEMGLVLAVEAWYLRVLSFRLGLEYLSECVSHCPSESHLVNWWSIKWLSFGTKNRFPHSQHFRNMIQPTEDRLNPSQPLWSIISPKKFAINYLFDNKPLYDVMIHFFGQYFNVDSPLRPRVISVHYLNECDWNFHIHEHGVEKLGTGRIAMKKGPKSSRNVIDGKNSGVTTWSRKDQRNVSNHSIWSIHLSMSESESETHPFLEISRIRTHRLPGNVHHKHDNVRVDDGFAGCKRSVYSKSSVFDSDQREVTNCHELCHSRQFPNHQFQLWATV